VVARHVDEVCTLRIVQKGETIEAQLGRHHELKRSALLEIAWLPCDRHGSDDMEVRYAHWRFAAQSSSGYVKGRSDRNKVESRTKKAEWPQAAAAATKQAFNTWQSLSDFMLMITHHDCEAE
jgi:hypothetical protein